MEFLTAINVILTIIVSAISIYAYAVERRGVGLRGPGPTAATMEGSPDPPASAGSRGGAAQAAPPPRSSPAPQTPNRLLHQVVACFWGFLGVSSLSEALTFGDGSMLLLSGLFFWLAHKFWPRAEPADAQQG